MRIPESSNPVCRDSDKVGPYRHDGGRSLGEGVASAGSAWSSQSGGRILAHLFLQRFKD